jgi:hypothetical protein
MALCVLVKTKVPQIEWARERPESG